MRPSKIQAIIKVVRISQRAAKDEEKIDNNETENHCEHDNSECMITTHIRNSLQQQNHAEKEREKV